MSTDQSQAVGFFHPTRGFFRVSMLLVISSLLIGSYFAYDSVGAIAVSLTTSLNLGRSVVGQLYTAYSVAAILIVFFGGMLTDRLGVRKASLLFSALVALGALIVALATNTWTLFLGRFIFGAGSESLVVAQQAMLTRWFKGRQLAMAFGVSLTVARLGTLFSFNTEELIARHFGHYSYALWAAALLCVAGLLLNVLYAVMDRCGQRTLPKETAGAGDKIVLADIKKFTPSYWYVVALCVTFYSAIFPFTALSTDMFHAKWGLPLDSGSGGSFLAQVLSNYLNMFKTAPGVTSIVIFASMVFAPFAGSLVDRIGRRGTLMVLGSLALIPAHLVLGFTQMNPVLPMIALGAAFVLVPAALWPSVPLVVDESRVGTAFGLMTAIQNLGLALFPFLNGWLRDLTGGYTATQAMFGFLGVVGLGFAFLLLRADRQAGGVLERGQR